MENRSRNMQWITLGIVLILIVLIVDVVLTVRLSAEVKSAISTIRNEKSLPCAAIPTKYILQEPECADKLLRVMNVTNVRVLPRGSSIPGYDEDIRARLANVSN